MFLHNQTEHLWRFFCFRVNSLYNHNQSTNMTAREFAYWLQGLFEIGNPSELTADQVVIIERHLDMVFAYDKSTSAAMDFCLWAKGFLATYAKNGLAGDSLKNIKNKLNAIFFHEIDKTYGDKVMQDTLNALHTGNKVPNTEAPITTGTQTPKHPATSSTQVVSDPLLDIEHEIMRC